MGTCACLTMNGVGKPCAGEPHARFDRGPLGTVDAQARWNPCTQRETDGTEPIRRTGYTEPAAYLTGMQPRIAHPGGPWCRAKSETYSSSR